MFCPNCFREKQPEGRCPLCGYEKSERARSPIYLPLGSVVNGKYMIGQILGNPGGFSVTYLGFNSSLQKKVAIKEFLPRQYVSRADDGRALVVHEDRYQDVFLSGLRQFITEARILARFNEPSIVQVFDVFDENKTAYIVMDYYEGQTLTECLQKTNAPLTEQAVMDIFLPILHGLAAVHAQGILHRDIKPDNIYITKDNKPILLDFGAARCSALGADQSLSVILTPGFAPYEQYQRKGLQGPWTDIYACAATMYYLLTLRTPVDSLERMSQDGLTPLSDLVPALSPNLVAAISKALSVQTIERQQDVFQFIADLTGKVSAVNLSNQSTVKMNVYNLPKTMVLDSPTPPGPVAARSRSPIKITAAIIVAIAVLLAGGYAYYSHVNNPVTQLAAKGIDYTGQAFLKAVRDGNAENITLFLRAGMNPNTVSDGGVPALLEAIASGKLDSVKALEAKGADFAMKDKAGASAFDYALKQGDIELVKLVFERQKIDAKARDDKGVPWIEKAAAANNLAAVQFLQASGADINAKDKNGATLLDKTLLQGRTALANDLKVLGAKQNVNRVYPVGQLTQIPVGKYGREGSFEIDLLGTGEPQTVAIAPAPGFNKISVKISAPAKGMLLSFVTEALFAQRCYAAYLRSNEVPELICYGVAADGIYARDFRVIGRAASGSLKELLFFQPNMPWLFTFTLDSERNVLKFTPEIGGTFYEIGATRDKEGIEVRTLLRGR